MITPRTTRLLRTRSLKGYLDAVRAAASGRPPCLVLVPTRAAARRLTRTLQDDATLGTAGDEPPDVRTRGAMYERLVAAVDARGDWLSPFERDVILERGVHEAVTEGLGPPFNPRPALMGEMLELYDELRRHQQDVEHFERLLVSELEPHAALDRGAERVLRQTRFLASAFRSYRRDVRARGALDEHELRERLLAGGAASPWRRVVVTAADRPANRGGLWPADFDLLARLDGIEHLDIVVTEAQLATGLHERVHALLPGLEEVRFEGGSAPTTPVLLVPADEVRHFTSRDREEELAAVVRGISDRVERADVARLARTAVVFARPLPYLYLAREIFTSEGVPFQSEHALPLAAEPIAAAVDLVLTFVSSRAGRDDTLALLRSPHFRFPVQAADDWETEIGALEAVFVRANYTGGIERLSALAGELSGDGSSAARAAVAAASTLEPLTRPAPAVTQLSTLKQFIDEHQTAPQAARDLEARRAVQALLENLIEAHRRTGTLTWTIEELAPAVRRWIEAHTFEARTGDRGIHLVDAASARYGAFDEVHLVGLVEGDWPERRRRNIFYSSLLLKRLGWTETPDPLAVDRAAFHDLLHLASRRTSVSTVQLEDDSLVEPSPLLEELAACGLDPQVAPPRPGASPADELLRARITPDSLPSVAAPWARIRQERAAAPPPPSPGRALPAGRSDYAVGSVELYAHCPFKYFSRHVLGLREEIDEEDGLSARDRGIFVHEVLCTFFERWQASGRGAVTAALLDEALALLDETAGELLARLPPADASIERARLLGSPVAPGIADLVLRMEAERSTAVIERRLEDRFEGTFELTSEAGARALTVRGIVDRIDLLADGVLRVLDYKSSVPQVPLQLAIYAATAVQRLAGERGRRWTVGEASYVVYGPRRGVKPLARTPAELPRAIEEAELRFVAAVEGIESGQFPPRPAHVRLCASCAYSTVCRKEYPVEPDDTDTASPV